MACKNVCPPDAASDVKRPQSVYADGEVTSNAGRCNTHNSATSFCTCLYGNCMQSSRDYETDNASWKKAFVRFCVTRPVSESAHRGAIGSDGQRYGGVPVCIDAA